MRKKLLTVILALIAAVCLCFGLVACGDTPKDPSGGTQTEQGSADGSEDNGGNQDGDKEAEGNEDTNPDEGGSEEEGGDKQPDEGGEGTGGNKNPDKGGQGGSEGEGGNTPDEGDQGGDDDEPCAHQYTVENVCNLCGDEWEYTEGLTYELDKTTDTYAVGRYQNVSGDVVIPYGYQGKFVTSIEYNAFSECTGITSFTIPGSVHTIELGALEMENNNLEHIIVTKDNPIYKSEQDCLIEIATGTLILGCKNSVIPNDITAIGNYAFYNCSELTDTDIIIPNGVTSIGYLAFYNCGELTDITIPDSVTSIWPYAFEGTAYYNDQSHWDSDGVLYIDNHLIKAKTTLAGEYSVRAGTKTIAGQAFSVMTDERNLKDVACLHLTGIKIPDSVVSIGIWAFFHCSGLTSVTIGSGMKAIGFEAFSGCYKLMEVWNYSELELQKGSVENGCVAYNAKFIYTTDEVDKRTITDDGCIFYEDGEETYLLGYQGHNRELTLPEISPMGKEYEICRYAFSGHSELIYLTIGSGVTRIGEGAFEDCTGIENVNWNAINCKVDKLPFDGCTNLKTVTVGEKVQNVPQNAFYQFENIIVDAGNQNYSSQDGVLYNKEKTEILQVPEAIKGVVRIPAGVTEIKDRMFAVRGLTSIFIPASVTKIGERAFGGRSIAEVIAGYGRCDNLESITVDEDNPNYSSQDGILYNKAQTELIFVPEAIKGTVTIPGSVTMFEYSVFWGCSGLEGIKFNGTVNEWRAIKKGNFWDGYTDDFTVTCTDGTVDKQGIVTYFEG